MRDTNETLREIRSILVTADDCDQTFHGNRAPLQVYLSTDEHLGTVRSEAVKFGSRIERLCAVPWAGTGTVL